MIAAARTRQPAWRAFNPRTRSGDNKLGFFTVATGALDIVDDPANVVAFHPQGHVVATGSGNELRLFDTGLQPLLTGSEVFSSLNLFVILVLLACGAASAGHIQATSVLLGCK